jgi:predicted phage terminase large subunit-like protein
LRPHPGRQTQFLESKADIVIYGGAGGGGKSYGLLMDAARHIWVPGYVAKIFRRTYKQVKQDGGIWDKTFQIYPKIGLTANNSELFWENRQTAATVGFGNLETDADRYNYDGAELAYIGFDEIQHFTSLQFWHLLSRNRSTCGVRSVFRGTCNPDPDCFVKPIIRWWLDEAGQFPDLSKAGVIRWFTRSRDGDLFWHDTDTEQFWGTVDYWKEQDQGYNPQSLTFIPASVDDNPSLEGTGYKAKLMSLPLIERQRLLYGDWLIKESAGNIFIKERWQYTQRVPKLSRVVRAWDFAGRKKDRADATAGLLIGLGEDGFYYLLDLKHFRAESSQVRQTVIATAEADRAMYPGVTITIPQDPGQAGLDQAQSYIAALSGFSVKSRRPSENKILRADPVASQQQAGRVFIVQGAWNQKLIDECDAFPDGANDDIIDALSDGFNELTEGFDPFAGWK